MKKAFRGGLAFFCSNDKVSPVSRSKNSQTAAAHGTGFPINGTMRDTLGPWRPGEELMHSLS